MENFEKKYNAGTGEEGTENNVPNTPPVDPSQEVNNGNFIPNNNIMEEKPNNKIYIILTVVVLLVVALGAAGYFYLNSDSYKNSSTTENEEATETTPDSSAEEENDTDSGNSNDQVSNSGSGNDEQQIVSSILNLKQIVLDKDVASFRNLTDVIPDGVTDEEILEQLEMFGWVFEDVNEEILNSGNTSFDFEGDTVVVGIEYDEDEDGFSSSSEFYFIKENGQWVFTDPETIDMLRAKPLENISQEISVTPTSQEVFNYYQLSIQWSEGIKGKVFLNDVEVFEEGDGDYMTSFRNLNETILNKNGENTIDLSIESVGQDLSPIGFGSDAFVEILIYAVDEQVFASEEDELIRIDVADELQEGDVRYKFNLGQ